jgi:hypothetical protein
MPFIMLPANLELKKAMSFERYQLTVEVWGKTK